jgi:hypothetical protein
MGITQSTFTPIKTGSGIEDFADFLQKGGCGCNTTLATVGTLGAGEITTSNILASGAGEIVNSIYAGIRSGVAEAYVEPKVDGADDKLEIIKKYTPDSLDEINGSAAQLEKTGNKMAKTCANAFTASGGCATCAGYVKGLGNEIALKVDAATKDMAEQINYSSASLEETIGILKSLKDPSFASINAIADELNNIKTKLDASAQSIASKAGIVLESIKADDIKGIIYTMMRNNLKIAEQSKDIIDIMEQINKIGNNLEKLKELQGTVASPEGKDVIGKAILTLGIINRHKEPKKITLGTGFDDAMGGMVEGGTNFVVPEKSDIEIKINKEERAKKSVLRSFAKEFNIAIKKVYDALDFYKLIGVTLPYNDRLRDFVNILSAVPDVSTLDRTFSQNEHTAIIAAVVGWDKTERGTQQKAFYIESFEKLKAAAKEISDLPDYNSVKEPVNKLSNAIDQFVTLVKGFADRFKGAGETKADAQELLESKYNLTTLKKLFKMFIEMALLRTNMKFGAEDREASGKEYTKMMSDLIAKRVEFIDKKRVTLKRLIEAGTLADSEFFDVESLRVFDFEKTSLSSFTSSSSSPSSSSPPRASRIPKPPHISKSLLSLYDTSSASTSTSTSSAPPSKVYLESLLPPTPDKPSTPPSLDLSKEPRPVLDPSLLTLSASIPSSTSTSSASIPATSSTPDFTPAMTTTSATSISEKEAILKESLKRAYKDRDELVKSKSELDKGDSEARGKLNQKITNAEIIMKKIEDELDKIRDVKKGTLGSGGSSGGKSIQTVLLTGEPIDAFIVGTPVKGGEYSHWYTTDIRQRDPSNHIPDNMRTLKSLKLEADIDMTDRLLNNKSLEKSIREGIKPDNSQHSQGIIISINKYTYEVTIIDHLKMENDEDSFVYVLPLNVLAIITLLQLYNPMKHYVFPWLCWYYDDDVLLTNDHEEVLIGVDMALRGFVLDYLPELLKLMPVNQRIFVAKLVRKLDYLRFHNDSRKDLYYIAESVELYLKEFTNALAKGEKSYKDIKDMVEAISIKDGKDMSATIVAKIDKYKALDIIDIAPEDKYLDQRKQIMDIFMDSQRLNMIIAAFFIIGSKLMPDTKELISSKQLYQKLVRLMSHFSLIKPTPIEFSLLIKVVRSIVSKVFVTVDTYDLLTNTNNFVELH